MKVNFVEEKENPLLGRKELVFEIEDCTIVPSRSEVTKQVSTLKGADESLTVVQKLDHRFGSKKITGTAKIYSSKEAFEKIEPYHMVWRHLPKEERKKKFDEKKAAAAKKKK